MAQTTVTANATADWGQIQRVVLRGYLKLPWAHFLLLRVKRPADARRWLGHVLDSSVVKFGWGSHGDPGPTGALAMTSEGLAAFGLDAPTIDGFSPEFVDGLTVEARSRILHDEGDSAPSKWLWGSDGNRVHVALLLYATTETAIKDTVARHRAAFAAGGVEELRGPDGAELGECRPLPERREHFGFADGISQPRFANEPHGVRGSNVPSRDSLATGELVLGYENEAGLFPRSPTIANRDFGKNGSYLVFRQLDQDVGAFWRTMGKVNAEATVEQRVWLASKMIGRWPNGAPLVTTATEHAPKARDAEDFDFFHDDPFGERCPLSAHIRRANPRATLSRDPDLGLAKSKKHRILRRGRSYGTPFVEPLVPEELVRAAESATGNAGPRGLHFLCFNADIANQFEFIQQTWVNGSAFQGLHGEVDPLLGDPSPTGGLFTIPGNPARKRVCGIPRFVTVRGGAYFFAPSEAALRFLARHGEK